MTHQDFVHRRQQHVALQHALQRHVREGKKLQGFAIQHVQGGKDQSGKPLPDFAYTIGLHERGYPELLISGLSAKTRVQWLLDLGFRMAGPPPLPLPTRLRLYGQTMLAWLHGHFVAWPTFPPGGQTFQVGVRYTDLAEGDYPTIFAEVASRYYRTHLGLAMRYYSHRNFRVLQVVWPDVAGRFPWDEQAHTFQQCFFDQRHLIALLAAQAPTSQDMPPVHNRQGEPHLTEVSDYERE